MKIVVLVAVALAVQLQAVEKVTKEEQSAELPNKKEAVVPAGDPIGEAVEAYFTAVFYEMGKVAAKQPTKDTFRELMKLVEKNVDGFLGGSFLDDKYIIQESYKDHIISPVGRDLKKVKELKGFLVMMDEKPASQLSEPAHIPFYPSFTSLRYPVLNDKGELTGVLSVFVKTKHFMETTMLSQCRAYTITCRGHLSERKKKVSDEAKKVTVLLPSTEWIIVYDPPEKGFVYPKNDK
jgi:hypothetical protein